MEGRSLVDGLAWVGTQFGGSAVWASRSPPAQQIEFGSTFRCELGRLVQRAGTVRRPGLAFLTRAAAERHSLTGSWWLARACHGMALKRERAIAVRQSCQQFLGRGGPTRP